MTKAELMPRDRAMWERAQAQYNNMRYRFAEKRSKKTRKIIQIGRPIPFTLSDFREWLLVQFGGRADGVAKCRYCPRILTALDFQIEHVDPAKQGGSLGLENLAVACEECNRYKGELSEKAFDMLRQFIRVLQEDNLLADAQLIEQRIKISGAVNSMRARLATTFKKKEPQAPPLTTYQQTLDDF
jgi:5-methylcytosine-specific restriction endonuclease McrA